MTYLYDNDSAEDKKESSVPQIIRDGGKAIAEGSVVMNSAAFQAFMTNCSAGGNETWTHARLVGILAAKRADDMLAAPFSVSISGVDMQYSVNDGERRITVKCEVRTKERIGGETSALVGCGVVLMSLVNGLRAIDKVMSVEGLRILRDKD